MTRIWALLAAASCAPAPSPPPLLGPEGPVDLSGLPLRSVSADDPIAGAAKLVGVEASAALERAGIDTSTVAFVCSDGYRARVPRDAVEREGALLVFARTDGAPFESMAGVDLSPYYLYWPASRDEPARPWGVTELVPLQPPPSLLRSDHPGVAAFLKHCSTCHQMDGWGGAVGPELHTPVPIARWVEAKWLRRWLLEPQSVRSGTPMPGLPSSLPDRQRVADSIVDFLQRAAAENDRSGSAQPNLSSAP